MSKDINTVRETLLKPRREAKRRKDEWKARGRLGEILIEAWLREIRGLEVLVVPQTKGTKREFVSENGKRPDFMASLSEENGAPAVNILFDAKFLSVGKEKLMWISEVEMQQYDETMREWGCDLLFFALVPLEYPNQIVLIERSEMINDSGRSRWTFGLTNGENRYWDIPAEFYQRSVRQLGREGYDIALVPTYPGSK